MRWSEEKVEEKVEEVEEEEEEVLVFHQTRLEQGSQYSQAGPA